LFPLYDHLGLHSTSGHVKVGVVPKPVDNSAPASAELDVYTVSSSVSVNLPINSSKNTRLVPPPRNYVTRVKTTSGAISGTYYHGSVGDFKTTSASIRITALPVLEQHSSSSTIFETSTQSGATRVDILDPVYITLGSDHRKEMPRQPKKPDFPFAPIGDDDPYLLLPPKTDGKMPGSLATIDTEPIRTLRSTHLSISGSVAVAYPKAWEGIIQGTTLSGSIKVSGEGVHVISEKSGIINKEVVAKKGVDKVGEGSAVELTSISGRLEFTIT